jgi:hypothetical protein
MKKTLLSVAVLMAGSAFATPYNAGDSRTFAMGGIGVSSADAGQASIMNPALLATSLRREAFSLDIDVVALSPKVGGFGAIANDFLEEDIINRGIDIFSTLETEVSGTGGLIELGDSLQTSVAGLAFTPTFTVTALTVPTPDISSNAAAGIFFDGLTALESSLTLVSTDITTLNTDLTGTSTGLTTISTDTLSVQTQLTSLSTTTTTDLNDVTDDLIGWLESFATKDAYVEASVLPISFALPSRNFGFGIHLSNSIQIGATLNLSANDTTFLGNAVEDSNGLLTEATTSVGDVAGTISTNTSTTSDLITHLTAVQTDLSGLNLSITELKTEITNLKALVEIVRDSGPLALTTDQIAEVTRITNVLENIDPVTGLKNTDPVTGSVDKVTASQENLTETDSGSVAVLSSSVTALSELAGGLTTALDSVNTYDGPNGIIVDGTPAVSTDDLTSTVRVALAAIQEVGVSVAKEVVIQGQTVSIGLTPKLQIILIEDQSFGVEAVDTSTIGQNLTPIVKANLDIGVAKEWDFHGRVKAGATIKNIIPYTVTSKEGVEVNLRPKMRLGVSHHTEFSTIGVDYDVTNNSAFYFGIPTRELSVGSELSLWGHAALRAGARWNTSDPDETGVFTTGLGLTPFGTGLNLAFWVPFDAFTVDYGQVIADITDNELSSALTTGDQLLRDFGFSVNLQVSW